MMKRLFFTTPVACLILTASCGQQPTTKLSDALQFDTLLIANLTASPYKTLTMSESAAFVSKTTDADTDKLLTMLSGFWSYYMQ